MTRHPSDGSPATGTLFAVSSVASVQLGAAVAATLFSRTGVLGTVSLRFVAASCVLLVLTRPWKVRWRAADMRTVVAFGLAFAAMNSSLYLAISRLPLATAITLEFLGPLGVAVVTATGARQRVWALPAAVGVALIGGSLRADDLVGTVAALCAALAWASYILLSRRMGTSEHGLAGLALATLLGAAVVAPFGVATAGSALVQPRVLLLGATVGVLASALPYSLDLLALRRLRTAVFGVLTSLNPAAAALAGLVVLGELPPHRQLLGIALVVVASVGVTASGRRPRAARALTPTGTPATTSVEPRCPSAGPPAAGPVPPHAEAGRQRG
jgi:inner membrane transporter RhtA